MDVWNWCNEKWNMKDKGSEYESYLLLKPQLLPLKLGSLAFNTCIYLIRIFLTCFEHCSRCEENLIAYKYWHSEVENDGVLYALPGRIIVFIFNLTSFA